MVQLMALTGKGRLHRRRATCSALRLRAELSGHMRAHSSVGAAVRDKRASPRVPHRSINFHRSFLQ